MISEKTINICGKDVRLRYCTATELSFEQLTGKSADVFIPEFEKDEKGNITKVTQKATGDDYIKLAISAMIAAYGRNDEEAPVGLKEILYDADPNEVVAMIEAVVEIRNKWYNISSVVEPEKSGESEKNA